MKKLSPIEFSIEEENFSPPFKLSLKPGAQRLSGSLTAKDSGLLILYISVPRPLRMRYDEIMILDEALHWRSFQRLMRAVVFVPLSTQKRNFRFEVGSRPWIPSFVEHECPSRNREKVKKELLECFPDEISISAEFYAGQKTGPALSLRFHAGQFIENGVIFQELVARRFDHELNPPPDEYPRSDFRYEKGNEIDNVIISSLSGLGFARDFSTPAEIAAGRRRLYLPISVASEVPISRRPGLDPRPEPHLVPVAEVKAKVYSEGTEAIFSMPLFESMGRLAPVREYRRLPFPDLDAILATVPEPVLPCKWQHFGAIYREAWFLLKRLERQPEPSSGLPNHCIRTSLHGFEHYQFVWDSSFTCMAAKYAWRSLPVHATLDVLYSRQMDGGYIHREHDIRDGMPVAYEPDFSPNPPLMPVAELALAQLTGDRSRFRLVYPALSEQFLWLEANRRLPNGVYWTTGLANGLDNSPSLGDGYPDLTAQMAHYAEILATMAKYLGKEEDAENWKLKYNETAEAANQILWSDKLKFYCTWLNNGEHNPNKIVTGFWPLWAGIVSPERVEYLASHLKNPSEFWRHHPVPSLSADSPQYVPQGDYWRGSTWAPTNYAVSQGFQRAGRTDLARELVERHLQVMYEVFQATGHLWENYCAESSAPGSWATTDYSWTTLAPIASLIETLIGLRGDALQMRLEFEPEPHTKVGIKRYPLGPATIEILQMIRNGKDTVEVQTDYPFELLVKRKGKTWKKQCLPGKNYLSLE
ncbi:MAG: trehalase family glycosidase [Candidatus Nanoarchaeia archaeon]